MGAGGEEGPSRPRRWTCHFAPGRQARWTDLENKEFVQSAHGVCLSLGHSRSRALIIWHLKSVDRRGKRWADDGRNRVKYMNLGVNE